MDQKLFEMSPFPTSELQLLSQVMSLYPAQWDGSSKRMLLMDMTVVENDPFDRLNRMKDLLLLPLSRIVLSEREAVKLSKEAFFTKEHEFQSSILAIQEERDAAVRRLQEEVDQSTQQNMLIEILLSDMDKMARTSEQLKKEIQRLEHTLLVKDLQIQRLDESHRENLLVTQTNAESFNHSSNMIESWNFTEATSVAETGTPVDCDCSSSVSSTMYNFAEEQPVFSSKNTEKREETTGLLQLVLVGMWTEGISSAQIVQDGGLSSLPIAVIHFWLGMASRIATHINQFIPFNSDE